MKVNELFRYQLKDCLHDSDSVAVYRAQQEQSDQTVILKVVEKTRDATESLSQLQNEYEILTDLASLPCVPSVIDYVESNTHAALVLHDSDGINLDDLCKKQPLSQQDITVIISQCFRAVEAIHRHQVIHKDIKPSNILVNPEKQQVWLIDFGLAIRFNQKSDQYYYSASIAGSLCYMPPEQTGRVNRQIDYRSDYYSIGVTAYQLLTGCLPFSTEQTDRELLYDLLAREAVPPHHLLPGIPETLSAIIMKLMEKDAENRYQTTEGVIYDLEHSLTPDQLTLGQQDILAHFLPPQKMYGRDQELTALKRIFQRVEHGEQQCALVAGYSGVGKTALVHELYREINASRAFLLEGKFDQLQRNQPLYGFTKAFEDFFASILTQPESDMEKWRRKVAKYLGDNAGVVTQHIANLEHLLGVQPEPLYLAGVEGFNRLIFSFQSLIQSIASADHPLIIFIDDLQWVDDASLKLLEQIYRDNAAAYTLVIGAYRDNEVEEGQALLGFIQKACSRPESFQQITLDNLPQSATVRILEDGFRHRIKQAEQLAGYLHEKTAGNPFFTIQFITKLIDEGIVCTDSENIWRFDAEQLQTLSIADNVAELMQKKIQQFPPALSELLFIAAAIGHEFSIDALRAVSGTDAHQVRVLLMPAIQDGLLIGGRDTLRFAHDGIQQAALEGEAFGDVSRLHGQIAHYLLARYEDNPAQVSKHIFDICFHLNACEFQTAESGNLIQRVRLNYQAAYQARQAAAYQAACDYIELAIQDLQQTPETDSRALSFSVYREAVESAYLIGNTHKAVAYSESASSFAEHSFEKCQLMNLRVVQLVAEGDYQGSMEIGIAALNLLGVTLPEPNDIPAGEQYYALKQTEFEQQWIHSGKSIADLYHLPLNQDHEISFIMELLGSLYASALMSYPDYLKVITITLLDLSVKHGNTLISPIAYAWHGSSIAAISDCYDEAYAFGQLAIRLNEEQINNPVISCKLYNMVGNFIAFFKEPLQQTLPLLSRAYELGIASGDKLYASYSLINEHRNALSTGMPLEDWLQADEDVRVKLALCDAHLMIEVLESFKSHVLRLTGQSQAINSLDNADFNEQEYREKFSAVPLFGALLDSWKIQSSYLLGEYDDALSISCFDVTPVDGFWQGIELRFFAALTLLRYLRTEADSAESQARAECLQQHMSRIEVLAASCPENFSHLWCILQAEQARLAQNPMAAAALLNEAMTHAGKNKYLHYEALANELLACLFFEHQLTESADTHIRKAWTLYSSWGSTAKLHQLAAHYPDTEFEENRSLSRMISSGYLDQKNILQKVDFNSLIEVSLALSSEMDINSLMSKLMTAAVENAGAQKCLLLMLRNGSWQLVAEQYGNQSNICNNADITLEEKLPLSVFNYVSRSGNSIVLGDAASHKIHSTDLYVMDNNVKSLICIPLIHNGETRAVLYLENSLVKHAFNQNQVTRLELLSSQMAAAIDNAENYRLLSDRELEYRGLLKNLPVGIIVCDTSTCIRYVNPLAYQFLKLSKEDVVGFKANDLPGKIFNEAGKVIKIADHPINIVLEHQTKISGEVYGYQQTDDAELSWYMTSAFPQYQDGKIDSVITCIVDITARKENEQKVQHLVYHDPLTDLPNRTYLETLLNQLIMKVTAENAFSALIIMDIDNFKVINDSLGHWIGDKMLNQVAQRIQTVVDDDIFLARLGGDAFALLFSSLSRSLDDIKERIEETGRAIKAAFEMPFQPGGNDVKTTISFGVSVIPEDGNTVDSALRYADIALSHSKKGGRNRLSYFKEEHETELKRQIELEKDLHTGIEANQLSLVYQPKVNIQTGEIVGAEALVRWHHPQKGMISPAEFIPIAEDSDLIIKLGQWVLNEACRQLSLWQRHKDFASFKRMSVNISPFQFKKAGFISGLTQLLSIYSIRPDQLDLEVTEYLLLEQTDVIVGKLNKLRSMGVTVSIDDFGTGYSSLSYLKRLPVDTLKVDQSFVFEMTESENDKAIVRTILAMAQTLQLKTVAEGVESEAHLELLKQYHCDEYQGYFFSKPVSPDQFEALMAKKA